MGERDGKVFATLRVNRLPEQWGIYGSRLILNSEAWALAAISYDEFAVKHTRLMSHDYISKSRSTTTEHWASTPR